MIGKFGPNEEVSAWLPGDFAGSWVRVKESAECRQSKLAKSITTEGIEDEALGLPQIGVGSAGANP